MAAGFTVPFAARFRALLLAGAGVLVLGGTASGQATVSVGAASNPLSTAHPSATFPVAISRSSSTSLLGFSVVFTLSSSLSLPAGNASIVIGGFLGSTGASSTLQIRNLGGGQYAADGVTLGTPCGTTSLAGTLFTVEVSATGPPGTGTITIDGVTLRDCANAPIASSIGSAGSVTITKATSTTLGVSVNPSRFGDAVTLSATIAFTPPGADVASGSVTFYDGASPIATVPVASNAASTSTGALVVGPHVLSAAYSGDALYDGSTSATVSLEVKAEIVATAGAHGSIAPLGATLYSLNATPAYSFAADPGYHVASVTVDGGGVALTSPYTFAPLSANHTIDVQFAVNPPVPALTALTATTLRTGNGTSGVMRVSVGWEAVAAGSSVRLYRAGFGHYPEYNGNPTPGSVPAIPSDPPGAPWVLVGSFTGTGTIDTPAARDYLYYVAIVVDLFGTHSAVSNRTNGALDYALGDVSNGASPGAGDNRVNLLDISLLGSVYGRVLVPGDAFNYLDVGPTTDASVNGRPVTDDHVNFEDLVMFGLNFNQVSAPAAAVAGTPAAHDELALGAPASVQAGAEFDVTLTLHGTGAVHALSTTLGWDAAIARPVSVERGSALANDMGVALSPSPGVVDVAVLGAEAPGLAGDAELATVRFRALRDGDPGVTLVRTDARDGANRAAHVALLSAPSTPRVPSASRLDAAVPSPFRDRATLGFALARPGNVELAVFSVDGRRVRTLASGFRDAGEHHLDWDGRDDASQLANPGVYYLRLVTPQGRFSRRLTLLH